MKKLNIFLGMILIFIILFLVFSRSDGKKITQFVSPIVKDEKVLGVNLWIPNVYGNWEDAPNISASAAYFVDSKGSKVLYAKDEHAKLPIASLAKVMTVLIALEHKDLDYKYIVSQNASAMEPDKMELIAGEKLTLKELLYGIFLVSANDAAEVIAEGTVSSREEFIKDMNDMAKQLGMKDTYFANPTGLDEDSNNSYSCAYDLAILTRYLIKHYPQVVEISKTEHIFLDKTQDHQDYDMYSGINLLTTYPGVVGFKTGYTPEAGLTLITLAQRNGKEIIGVILGSGDRRDEAKELLDYSFKKIQ